MSGYTGVKFERKRDKTERKKFPEIEEELIETCKYLGEKGLAPALEGGGYGGNASFKKDGDIFITASGSNLGDMDYKEIVEVVSCSYKEFQCHYNGKKDPSSETILHWMIYRTFPDSMKVKGVLHGHYDPLVENSEEIGVPETEEFQEYGTKELVEEVRKLLEENPTKEFVAKDHGFFVMGETIQEAKERAKKLYKKSQEL